jgi:hypothetical protein
MYVCMYGMILVRYLDLESSLLVDVDGWIGGCGIEKKKKNRRDG